MQLCTTADFRLSGQSSEIGVLILKQSFLVEWPYFIGFVDLHNELSQSEISMEININQIFSGEWRRIETRCSMRTKSYKSVVLPWIIRCEVSLDLMRKFVKQN